MELERTDFWVIEHEPTSGVVELRWSAATATLTDPDFMTALERLGDLAGAQKASCLFEDLRDFAWRVPPEVTAWIDRDLVPRYRSQSITKWALIVGAAGIAGTSIRTGSLERRFFDTGEAARAWHLVAAP